MTHFFVLPLTLMPLKTCLDIRTRARLALRPIRAFFGALSIAALNFSLQRSSQATHTFSLRGLTTFWAGTRSATSLGGLPPWGGTGGAGVGRGRDRRPRRDRVLLAQMFQASATSTLEPCWALSPRVGPGGRPVSGNVAVTL